MNWEPFTGLQTAGGEPLRFFDEFGEELFAHGYIRVSGGNDARMPRRVIGIGRERVSAASSASRALSRYDDAPTIVSPR